MLFQHTRRIALLVVCGLISGAAACAGQDIIAQHFAGPFSADFTGTLPNQGTALQETFNVPSTSDVTIFTTSYESGGFQTNLLLYDAAGNFVTAGIPHGSVDPQTGLIGDSTLSATKLPAGNYILAVTDFLLNQSFTAKNLSDGFTSNFGSGDDFVDANGNPRSGDYAFSIQITAVPEPGSVWLLVMGAAGLALVAARRRKAAR